ncbi:MAG TPA: hypothetical protein VG709_04785 [Actinomycetota bacterium]|nr:hypothetical protein [Actinomycetota bacterium]
MPRRVLIAAAVAGTLLMGVVPAEAVRPPLLPYRGLGAWIDIYDDEAWDRPAATARTIAARGVRTLYLETCNFRCERDLFRPAAMARLLRASHVEGMKVVAWYLPGFQNVRRDVRRARKAIEFETSDGHRFDGFALDIEAMEDSPVEERNRRVRVVSRRLRELVGAGYALGAITPHGEYPWDPFPYRMLGLYYDVFLPMNYFAVRDSGARAARRHTAFNIRTIREETGIRNAPIHIIGGVADEMNRKEAVAFVRTAREHGVLGASAYDVFTSGPEDWRAMRSVPANPRQSPALPVALGYARPLGNLPFADRTHPKEVFFRLGGRAAGATLRFDAYGIQRDEVSVVVNWRRVGDVRATGGDWKRRRVAIPARLLRDRGPNTIGFIADGRFPNWRVWGVREVRLVAT